MSYLLSDFNYQVYHILKVQKKKKITSVIVIVNEYELRFLENFEGGDSQMNTLIWYSWLGGVIIGTMIGANMVLEEHCRAGPRNVVITGR